MNKIIRTTSITGDAGVASALQDFGRYRIKSFFFKIPFPLLIFQQITLGTIHLRRRQIFTNFWPLPPYRRQFFSTIRRQIWQIFDPSPPKACRRLKWMVPNIVCKKWKVVNVEIKKTSYWKCWIRQCNRLNQRIKPHPTRWQYPLINYLDRNVDYEAHIKLGN